MSQYTKVPRATTCRVCGGRIVYKARLFVWRHTNHSEGLDHAPAPVLSKETTDGR